MSLFYMHNEPTEMDDLTRSRFNLFNKVERNQSNNGAFMFIIGFIVGMVFTAMVMM